MEKITKEYLLDEAIKQLRIRQNIKSDNDFKNLVDTFRKENNIVTNLYDMIRDKLKEDKLITWAGDTINLTFEAIDFEGYVNRKNRLEGNPSRPPLLQEKELNLSKKLSIEPIQNNFDKTPIKDVHSHFYNTLVKTRYITEDELVLYLKSAFQNKQIPATLFSFKNTPTRQVIMKAFYEYYKNTASKPHGRQKEYAALLGDYFNGYNTKTVSTNFNK